jgi:hypothetical protein
MDYIFVFVLAIATAGVLVVAGTILGFALRTFLPQRSYMTKEELRELWNATPIPDVFDKICLIERGLCDPPRFREAVEILAKDKTRPFRDMREAIVWVSANEAQRKSLVRQFPHIEKGYTEFMERHDARIGIKMH